MRHPVTGKESRPEIRHNEIRCLPFFVQNRAKTVAGLFAGKEAFGKLFQ